jgi:pilus assembly protein CpaC
MKLEDMKDNLFQALCCFAVLMAMVLLPFLAEAASKHTRTVVLTAGKADTVDLGKSVADVLVANPAIADVGTLRSNRLYIVGRAIGETNVLAFDDQGNPLADINVRVRADDAGLKSAVRELFPKEDVQVSAVRDEIVLKGRVSTPSVANQVRDLASRFVTASGKTVVDLMSVNGEQQVMLKVKVVEARRNALREMGIDTDIRPGAASDSNLSTNNVGLTALTPFATGQLFIQDTGKFSPFRVSLQGLERQGLVNTLAEPTLTAISGETAGFLAGGEFPVPTGRDQDGNITLEFKQFGVSLNFTPTVLSPDRISMQLSTEVSAKSDEDSVTLINVKIPGLTVRRAETTVQLASGGTIMIAGLIKSDTIDSVNGMPGVKDLPIIGELFKSKSFARNETELLIIVTPYIVEPFAEAQAVETSADYPQSRVPMMAPPASLPERSLEEAPATGLSRSDRRTAPAGATERSAPVSAVEKDGLPPAKPALAAKPRVLQRDRELSVAFARNLKNAYGAKASLPQGKNQTYGYILE